MIIAGKLSAALMR